MSNAIQLMESALAEALEFIEGYEDILDGADGRPLPNRAMCIAGEIKDALDALEDERRQEREDNGQFGVGA